MDQEGSLGMPEFLLPARGTSEPMSITFLLELLQGLSPHALHSHLLLIEKGLRSSQQSFGFCFLGKTV